MSVTKEVRFVYPLKQAGFVGFKQWKWDMEITAEAQQQQLLGVLRNEPQATELL
jgi:hypothetical protein